VNRYHIDETPLEHPLASEVVLHVRRHLRVAIRQRAESAPRDLALLFGFPPALGRDEAWQRAARAEHPLQEGAALTALLRGLTGNVVPLGRDSAHVEECRQWLLTRKNQDEAFDQLVATDLATLLELSRARDLALAQGVDDEGRRRYLHVLIQGETGTGKEVVARAIHAMTGKDREARKEHHGPFRVVQVAGLPHDLVTSVLFGHIRGAFSDAKQDRKGLLEEADGGTVLIDEVGDLPHEAQLQLLRFLQSYRLTRLGDNKERPLNLRIIAATWHDLDADVKNGSFRQDLLHRLRVGSLHMPALRDREHFSWDVVPRILEMRGHQATPLLTASVHDALTRQPWPGNLRELVGVLEEAIALASGETIRLEHLPPRIQREYLRVPLHDRAPAFLVDEADERPLTPEHARFRVDQIAQSLEGWQPPEANQGLNALGEFLKLLGDTSDAGRHAQKDIEDLLVADQEHRRQKSLLSYWRKLASTKLPEFITCIVQEKEQTSLERMNQASARVSELRSSTHLRQNPWLNLLREMQTLPLFAKADPGALPGFIVGALNILKLIAPKLVDEAREALAKGGLAELRRRIIKVVKESEDRKAAVDAEVDAGPSRPLRRPAARLSHEEWLKVAMFETQAEAVEETGFDPKTLKKYLKKHGIEVPWTRAAATTDALVVHRDTKR
jgi:transcriptional regulator with AAA-type ATPase domain